LLVPAVVRVYSGTSLIAASTLLTPPVYYGLAGSAASFASAFFTSSRRLPRFSVKS
jgi:hypothetical protein